MKVEKKRIVAISMIIITAMISLTSCKSASENDDITVISREEGSGTRSAFTELFEIVEKDSDGNEMDNTVLTADTQTSTGVVLTSVADNKNAIGYVSMGALNDNVKAVKIGGVEPTAENVKNNSYVASRPFNIVTNNEVSKEAKDFINFILSKEGQDVVEEEGYIASVSDAESYNGTKYSGTIKVSGSSSVTPVMQKLKEAYEKINPDINVEINMSDSTTGVSNVISGNSDIGMASRGLKNSEKESGAKETVIALDGIAVIVNTKNVIDNLSKEQVKDIYTGVSTTWAEVY